MDGNGNGGNGGNLVHLVQTCPCYLVTFTEKNGEVGKGPARDVRDAHIHHLRKLRENGILVYCGEFDTQNGEFQILCGEGHSVEQLDGDSVEQLVKLDPIFTSGYYRRYHIQGLVSVNPDEREKTHTR